MDTDLQVGVALQVLDLHYNYTANDIPGEQKVGLIIQDWPVMLWGNVSPANFGL